LEYTLWTERELSALQWCILGIINGDERSYSKGWRIFIETPPLRAIGGLALGINMLGVTLEENGAFPDITNTDDARLVGLCRLVPEIAGMPPADMADTIAICLAINEEETWDSILGIGSVEMVERLLIAAACLTVSVCAISSVPVTDQIPSFWASLGAPVSPA